MQLTVTVTDKERGVIASKDVDVTVLPLEQDELEQELALMERVKAAYFDGIKMPILLRML